jgi:hypothetical protein
LTRAGRSWRTVRPDCFAIDSASDASITNMGPSIFFFFAFFLWWWLWCFGSEIREMKGENEGSYYLEKEEKGWGWGWALGN